MSKLLRYAVLLLLLVPSAKAQSNQFRDTRAHLGVAAALFTYHGPIDLLSPRTASNFVREHEFPAPVFTGSFPIVGDRWYFRGLVVLTNFTTADGKRLVGTGKNEFLTKNLLLFEPEVVLTLRPGSKSRVLPYVFTGFGGMVADPWRTNDRIDYPGTGVPGPERSVFYWPIGAGIDVALDRCWSVFGEASYRFDMNYVVRNESNYDRHDTSLLMLGLRMCMNRRKITPPEPAPIPAPMLVPSYAPPLPRSPQICRLVDLNSVTFAYGSTTLDAEARRLLDENIEALLTDPMCCVEILGWTDEDKDDPSGLRLSRLRAEAVFRYYVDVGRLPAEKFTVTAKGVGEPCGKEKGNKGPGCPSNRRVDSVPFNCGTFIDSLRR